MNIHNIIMIDFFLTKLQVNQVYYLLIQAETATVMKNDLAGIKEAFGYPSASKDVCVS